MSDTDGFIAEVTEEVRRDRFYGLMKRYGWIVISVIVLLVGAAAWNEWRKAQAAGRAQAFGDAALAALSGGDDPASRAAAVAEITADSENHQLLKELFVAAERAASEDSARAT